MWDISNYLGSLITDVAKCAREIKQRINMAKGTFQQEEDSFQQKIGFKFKEETSKVLHLEHSFIW